VKPEAHVVIDGGEDSVARALNTASFAAANLVYSYADRFHRAEDYKPLEDLAAEVQRIVVETGCRILREAREP
jgi:hypothetical protein